MKNRKINIFAALTLGLMIAFAGCKKDDGGVRSSVVIKDVPVVSTKKESTGSQAIDILNLAAFSGKFKVELYFPGATPPDKVDIVVRKNGSNANVKAIKKDVTTLPYSLTVTSADISALFGVAIALGDTYDFAPDLYVGVNKYEAFPATGLGNGPGIIAFPLYSDYARFAAVCPSDLAGTYEFDALKTFCGKTYSGSITLTAVASAPGSYTVSDGTFGSWGSCYPDLWGNGNVRINDACGKLTMSGSDKYGDTYSMTFKSVTPSLLTFDWKNTYGEFGTVALKSNAGKPWPAYLK
jgi:hypothetical protein